MTFALDENVRAAETRVTVLSSEAPEPKRRVELARVREAYAALPLHRYRAVLRPRRDLMLVGEWTGGVLRGAFASTLRQLVCHNLSLACVSCRLRRSCAYPAVFDPNAAAAEPTLGRHVDPPQPFVVRLSEATAPERVPAGAELALDLHVVGATQRHTPHLLTTLTRLADDGLGPHRVPLELERVDALDAHGTACAAVIEGPEAAMRPNVAPALRAGDLAKVGDDVAAAVRVRFLTPTLLHQGGEPPSTPASFGALVRRLHARVGTLATLYGDGPLRDAPRALAAAADAIQARAVDLHLPKEDLRSSRTGARYASPRGFVGEAHYVGDLRPFMPLLRLGELLHVGKHASFGLGRIHVEANAHASMGRHELARR